MSETWLVDMRVARDAVSAPLTISREVVVIRGSSRRSNSTGCGLPGYHQDGLEDVGYQYSKWNEQGIGP